MVVYYVYRKRTEQLNKNTLWEKFLETETTIQDKEQIAV